MDRYFGIAEYVDGSNVIELGQPAKTDKEAIWLGGVEANDRINNPDYFGGKLVSFRTVVLRNCTEGFGPKFTAVLIERVRNGKYEKLSSERWEGRSQWTEAA